MVACEKSLIINKKTNTFVSKIILYNYILCEGNPSDVRFFSSVLRDGSDIPRFSNRLGASPSCTCRKYANIRTTCKYAGKILMSRGCLCIIAQYYFYVNVLVINL